MRQPGLTRREVLGALLGAPALRAMRLEPLAEALRSCTRDQALGVAVKAILGGADLPALLSAIFQAGVRDIRPRHVGGKLHAVMVVESIFRLAAATDRRSAWLLAFWSLDDFKRSQELDRQEGDWVLPPRPIVSFPGEPAARREFLAAMEDWDDARADRALVGLMPGHTLDSLFEVLWPLAARSYVNIGHKMIYAVQTRRVLQRIGWGAAEPALRSLVFALLHQPSGREMDDFERSRGMAAALPERLAPQKEDPAEARTMLRALRDLDSRAAQARVAAALRVGVAPATIWEALRVWASEIFLRRLKSQPATDRAALLPVHAVTVVNALGYAWRETRSEPTRRLLILQAAGWLPRLEDDLTSIVGLAPPGRSIDALADGVRDEARMAAHQSELIAHLARRGVEDHQHKYAAAVFEERRLVGPSWAPALLACAVPYLPGPAEPETELSRRSVVALDKEGL